MANPPNPPSPNDNEADRALMNPDAFLPITPNNDYINFDMVSLDERNRVVVEILRSHHVSYAMTASAHVPDIYTQQFWHTARIVQRGGADVIVGQVDRTDLQVTFEDFRRVLRLPAETEEAPFEEPVSGAILVSEIIALGVMNPPANISQFTQKMLPPLWSTMFNLLNRCLSSTTKGVDKATTQLWHIMHSVAYVRHIDYAAQLWLDFLKDFGGGQKVHSSIPWLRFINLLIRDHMLRRPDVRRRSSHPTIESRPVTRVNKRMTRPGQQTIQIPLAVLNRANQNAASVRAYRATLGTEVAPMDPPEPEGPSHRA